MTETQKLILLDHLFDRYIQVLSIEYHSHNGNLFIRYRDFANNEYYRSFKPTGGYKELTI